MALASTPVYAASALEEGKAAYQSGDYRTAIVNWRLLIQEGQPEGSFFLGTMYSEGKGVAQDHAKAFELYSEAAEKGFVPAQYNLGNQYANGEGTTRDYAKAEQWWGKAAEAGLMQAQLNLGHLYYFGAGGKKDPALARKWLTAAAAQGSEDAKATLAKLDAAEPMRVPPAKTAAAASAATPASAPPSAPPAPTSVANTAPTASAAAPVAPAITDTLRREAWALAQPPTNFTAQIMAIGAEHLAREHIQQHGLAGNAAYVESAAQGNTIYRIVYGSYASRAAAEKALAALPRAATASSPWVRSFAEIHKLIDTRFAQRGAP